MTNIGARKTCASTEFIWRRQNTGVNKILASTKYWPQQNVGIDKMLASTKNWRRQNIGAVKILAAKHAR
jgi:hypothetical protein